jgi:hypothetical protein
VAALFGNDAEKAAREGESEHAETAASKKASEQSLLSQIVHELLVVSGKKAWLALVAYESILGLLDSAGAVAWTEQLAAPILAHLGDKPRKWSPEKLLLALGIERRLGQWFPADALALMMPKALTRLQRALDPGYLQRYKMPDGKADDEDSDAEDEDEESDAEEGGDAAKSKKKAGFDALAEDDEDDVPDEAPNAAEDGAEGAAGESKIRYRPAFAAPLARAVLYSSQAYPRLHPVWGHLFQRYMDMGVLGRPQDPLLPAADAKDDKDSGKAGKKAAAAVAEPDLTIPPAFIGFCEVWRVYFDQLLMTKGPERCATGLSLLSAVLPLVIRSGTADASLHAKTRQVRIAALLTGVLSPLVVRSILIALVKKAHTLRPVASATLRSIVDLCGQHADTASAAMVALMARGHADFDRKTRTNTVAQLLSKLTDEAIVSHVSGAQREFSRPSTLPVYSDIATTSTGFTAMSLGMLAAVKGDGTASTFSAASALRGVMGRKKDGEEDDEDASDADEDDPTARPRHLSPEDGRRLWALDTLTSALRNPALPVLRQKTHAVRLISFLSFHAYADVQTSEATLREAEAAAAAATDSSAAAATPASAKLSGSKRPRESAGSRLLRSLADTAQVSTAPGVGVAAVLADPPLSDFMRSELRNRVSQLIKMLVSQQAAAAAAAGQAAQQVADAAAGKPQAQSGKQHKHQQQGGNNKQQQKGATPPLPLPAWNGISDRAAAASHIAYALSAAANKAYDIAAVAADETADQEDDVAPAADASGLSSEIVVTAYPPKISLQLSRHKEDDEDASDSDSDSDDASSTDSDASAQNTVNAAVARSRALQAAAALEKAGCSLLMNKAGANAEEGAPMTRESDAARALLSFAALLSQLSLHMLNDAKPAEVAAAVQDILDVVPVLLAGAIAAATAIEPAAAAVEDSRKSPASAKKGGNKPSAASSEPGLMALLQSLVSDSTAAEGTRDREKDLLVFTDAVLSLLANAPAAVRDSIKAATRHAFAMGVSVSAVQAMLDVMIQRDDGSLPVESMEDEEDSDSDDEEEAAEKKAKALKQDKPSKPVAKEDSDSDSDSGSESDEEDEDKDDAEDEEKGDAEFDRYDRMLASMIQMRRAAKSQVKESRKRQQTFRLRALELLELALFRIINSAPAPITASSPAVPSVLLLPVPMLKALRYLSVKASGSGTRSGKKGDNGASATTDAGSLANKLIPTLIRLSRTRFIAASAMPKDKQAPVAEQLLKLFDEVVKLVKEGPSPAFADACAAVASMVMRGLRGSPPPPTAHGKDANKGGNNPNSQNAANPSPDVRYIDRLAAGYSSVLQAFFSERRTRISPLFFTPIFVQMPSIAVRLLPALLSSIAHADMKPFRVIEAYTYVLSIVKSASGWAKDLPCAASDATDATPKGSKKPVADVAKVVNCQQYMRAQIKDILKTIVATLDASLKPAQATEEDGADGKKAEKAAAALRPKRLAEPLVLLTHMLKQGIVRPGEEGLEEALNTVVSVARTAGHESARQRANTCLRAVGWEEQKAVESDDSDDDRKAGASDDESGSDSDGSDSEAEKPRKQQKKEKKKGKPQVAPAGAPSNKKARTQ